MCFGQRQPTVGFTVPILGQPGGFGGIAGGVGAAFHPELFGADGDQVAHVAYGPGLVIDVGEVGHDQSGRCGGADDFQYVADRIRHRVAQNPAGQ